MWSEISTPVIFGHRGSPKHAPENTLASFGCAIDQGADAIELDAKLSRDNIAVVLHDPSVDRTTDGTGRVNQLSLAAIKELDAGSWYSEKYRGERIPTLEEVFEAVGKRILINVELTNYSSPHDRLVEEVVFLVKKYNLQRRLLFSSFFPTNLMKAKLLLPDTPCGLLAWAGKTGWVARNIGFRKEKYFSLHPNIRDGNAELIDRVHSVGKKIYIWTVNSGREIKRLIDDGADGIFTDDVSMVSQILGGKDPHE